MLKIKCDVNQQDLKRVDLYFANMNNFYPFEVADRVSETQLQVGENSNNNLPVGGLSYYTFFF